MLFQEILEIKKSEIISGAIYNPQACSDTQRRTSLINNATVKYGSLTTESAFEIVRSIVWRSHKTVSFLIRTETSLA